MNNQEYFKGFEISQEDLYKKAISQPLKLKIEKAIRFYQMHEPESGYTICDSGGKDSNVIIHLAKLAKVKYTGNYCNVTIDPPELIRFLKKERPETIWHNQGKHLLTRMIEKGTPPTRLARWCCQEYKENFGNFENKVIGVRAEESSRRKATWKEITKHRKTNSMIFAPILYWTEKDVWDFHKKYNLNYCELYDQGYKRLGCIGCPMAGKARKRDFERYPRYKKMWMRAFKKMWETNPNTKKGKPRFFMAFGSPENFFKWWMEEEVETEDCQMTDMFT